MLPSINTELSSLQNSAWNMTRGNIMALQINVFIDFCGCTMDRGLWDVTEAAGMDMWGIEIANVSA